MKNLDKAIVMAMTTGVISLSGVIQSEACGLGDTDFRVTASVLNVRTEPNTSTGVVTRKLQKGTVVRPVELTKDRTWARIGQNEWVSFDYLEMIDNSTNHENGASSIQPTKYVVNTDVLNLRAQPSTESKVLDKLYKGEVVTVTKKNGSWLYVDDYSNKGWIHSDYAKVYSQGGNSSNTTVEETVAMRELTVNTDVLNIRKGPSTNTEIVGKLKRGHSRMSNVKSGEWYKVEDGWIHEDYVDVTIWSMNSNSNGEGAIDAPTGDFSNEKTVTVGQGSNLLVRYTRALGGSIKDKLPHGTKVTVINDSNGVAYIKYYNTQGRLEFGYVASQYLK